MSEAKTILDFLKDISANNNREWFNAHRDRYEEARATFEQMVQKIICRIAQFDKPVGNVAVKDCLYRFHRDTRFSLDKSPYKTHLGAYINVKGKKSTHGGYYLHLEPGNCLIAGGAYCLPPQILKAVREDIMLRIDEFRNIVESQKFSKLFPIIGEDRLKTLPKGFPKDFPYPQYLRPKDYSCFHKVDDSFFFQKSWDASAASVFEAMKPFLDFVNETIDDYI